MHINAKNGGVTQQQQQNNHYFSQNQTKKEIQKRNERETEKDSFAFFTLHLMPAELLNSSKYIHTNCKCSLIHFKINAFDVAIYVVYDIVYRYILRLMNNICMYNYHKFYTKQK